MSYNFSLEEQNRVFINALKSELTADLPGVEAHLRLAPEMRVNDLKTEITPAHALESAVLILLYPYEGHLHTVVILRNEYDGAHSGQISLPGGKREKSDIDFKHTALREAQEEIGIIPANMEIVGQLSRFYVKPSNFIIYPYIAYTSHRPQFHPDPTEVQRIIEIDIFEEIRYDLINPRTLLFKNNIGITAPGFEVGGEFMWGATAMIFSELIQVLNKVIIKLR
jgi:8-oxo-dGTP pyrophosphatase MutT (NUDIX family)